MNILSIIPEKIKTAGRILFHAAPTGTGAAVGILPVGANGITVFCTVTMANAADLALSIVTADDAAGTTPVAISANIPIFVDDVRQTDAKSYTETSASAVKTVVFCVPPVLVPTGKYICLSYANSNAANILSAVAMELAINDVG